MVLSYVLLSCHQKPVLPGTLIPFTCRITQIDYVDTTAHDTYTYQYDQFGNRTGSDDGQKRVYNYDAANEYITSQQMDGVTLTYVYSLWSR